MVFDSARNLRNQWFPPSPQFTEKDVPSQVGKVFIVTGGNTGVGYALIKMLYGTGAKIYMASRSKVITPHSPLPFHPLTIPQDKAEKAILTLTQESPAPKTPGYIRFLQLDLSDLPSVKKAAETFAQQEGKLDILWNNAGVGGNIAKFGERTVQDLEPVVGANCVGTLLFSTLLVPQLKAASTSNSQARVVWTSSFLAEGASPKNGLDFNLLDLGTSDRTKNYAISKVGTWMLGREFARRYGKDNILSVIQNPGNLKTGAYDGVDRFTMLFINPLLQEPKFGGYTELFAGFSKDISLENNGAFVIPWGRVRPDGESPRKDILNAMTPEEEGGLGYGKKLWEWCEGKWRSFV